MKRLLLLLLLLPLFAFQTDTPAKLIGKWVSTDKEDSFNFLLFDEEGYATMGIDGRVLGGKEFSMDGKTGQMTYSVNMENDLIEIDLVLKQFENNREKTLMCIAEFVGDDQLKIAMGFEGVRPEVFDEEAKEMIVLTREK
uniref:hypothetical protein n=1 Tax=Gelidibacter sp. TaxID=2018083 RepID=UPI00404A953A